MKQFQFVAENALVLLGQLREKEPEINGTSAFQVLFHVHSEQNDPEAIHTIFQEIHHLFPGALAAGSASYGNIIEGNFSTGTISVTATIIEKQTTQAEVMSFPFAEGKAADAAAKLVEAAEERPWLKAVEVLIMNSGNSMRDFCRIMDKLPEDVVVFGGETHFAHSPAAARFVIGNDGECLNSGVVFVLYGGDELEVSTRMIRGWRPLGNAMEVTEWTGNRMVSLDTRPAHELYYKYLQINNDENFFFNVLEFPFLVYMEDGSTILRMPMACTEEGELILAAEMPDSTTVRIAYGDPGEIMNSIYAGGEEFQRFRPDVLFLFSCGCRRAFWGEDFCSEETVLYSSIASTSGFYTAGELLRVNGVLQEHNCTLVIAAMREGRREEKEEKKFIMRGWSMGHENSLIRRFATFISAASEELLEANRKLDTLSRTDDMTGLYNRREMERRLRQAFARVQRGEGVCRILLADLDNFKRINDSYGHLEGDTVLRGFADLLKECSKEYEGEAAVGRWGGEEFLVLLSGEEDKHAEAFAEEVCRRFAGYDFTLSGKHTVSVGLITAEENETIDSALSRADHAMYEAKHLGKNRVVFVPSV